MAATLSGGNLTINVTGTETDPVNVGSVSYGPPGSYRATLVTGTGDGQGNCRLIITGTVVSGTPVLLDLTAIATSGVISPTALTSIKTCVIQNNSGITGNDLEVGDSTGSATNAFSHFWETATSVELVKSDVTGNNNACPGTFAYANSAGAVVDSTHKILTLTSAAGTVTYIIDIMGTK